MADYGGAVVSAIKAMLLTKGASDSGLAAASQRGSSRKLPDKVAALRAWLRDERCQALAEWDEENAIGLPAYNFEWSHTPLRLSQLPVAWSPAWRAFHDNWVKPELDRQRVTAAIIGPKRSRKEGASSSVDLADLETLEELNASATSNDVHIEGDLVVKGLGHFAGIRTTGADNAEFYPKASPSLELRAGHVVGMDRSSTDPPTVSLCTTRAKIVGVVSDRPSVCGNAPIGPSDENRVPVVWSGWSGQVRVFVKGKVRAGDNLVPSGDDDGCARASSSGRDGFGIVQSGPHITPAEPYTVMVLMGAHARKAKPQAAKTDGWDFANSETGTSLSQAFRQPFVSDRSNVGDSLLMIKVRLVGLVGDAYEVDVHRDAWCNSVMFEIKSKIEACDDDIDSIDENACALVHCGSILENWRPIGEYGILEGDTIWLLRLHRTEAHPEWVDVLLDKNESLLRSIFSLGGRQPSDAQNQEDVYKLCEVVGQFCNSLTSGAQWSWTITEAEEQVFSMASRALLSGALSASGTHVIWRPEYACALLCSKEQVDIVDLRLVAVDGWRFHMQPNGSDHTHCARGGADVSVVLVVGTVLLNKWDDFMSTADRLLAAAQARMGDKRSAESNRQGNQKTPAMMRAVLSDALQVVNHNQTIPSEGLTHPRGGFTDVGLHTGGIKRDTQWVLVQDVLQVLLEENGQRQLCIHAILQLRMWLTEGVLASLTPETADAARVDVVMEMLRAVASEGVELVERGFDMAPFEARCSLIRYELSQIVNERAAAIAEEYELSDLEPSDFNTRNPPLSPPVASKPDKGVGGVDQVRKLAASNLAWLPEPLDKNATFFQAVQWLLHPRLLPSYVKSNSLGRSALLVLKSVESLVFTQAAMLTATTSSLASEEAVAMEEVVETYRTMSCAFRGLPVAKSLMQSELLSHELLVVWAAFCLSHQSTSRLHPLLFEFGVPLDADRLRHLVLSNKLARDAAVHVACYLRTKTLTKPIFSLLGGDTTFAFCQRFVAEAPGGADTRAKWIAERDAAATRQRARLAVVQQKLDRLVILDQEKRELDAELASWRQRLSLYEPPRMRSTIYRSATSHENDRRYREAESQVAKYESMLSAKCQEIRTEEVPPAPIFQPLPAVERVAQPILFFLFMPTEFQVLSRLSFTSQQMLVPRTASVKLPHNATVDVSNCIKIEANPETIWRDYYQTESTARAYTAKTNKVPLGSYLKRPKEVGPDNVRAYRAPSVIPGPSDGVWHPDTLLPVLFWNGGGYSLDTRGGYFNPFAASLPESVTAIMLTERLPEPFKELQWAMHQLGDDTQDLSRGNIAEAWQDQKPSWLSKQAYLCFGKIRAYPNQQLREVCVALHDRRLPMDHPAVRLLLQQTFFHLGNLSTDTPPRPQWRTDMTDHGGWAVLRQELESYADECKFKSREHGAVFLLGLIAAHASQWDAASREVARQFASIVWSWAEQLADELDHAAALHPERVPSLRARRCLFHMYGILCHGAGDLSLEDAAGLCKFLVLADYNRLFEEKTTFDSEVKMLTAITNEVLARRLPELLGHIECSRSMLTEAVKLVLHATPDVLNWTRVRGENSITTCFEALSHDGDLFSVNIQTGVILLNGLPPSRLPDTILLMPLYKRTFGDRNFEVVPTPSGALKSIRPIDGCFYEFFVSGDGRLVVCEDNEQVGRLELLDGIDVQWGARLPLRLRSRLYSHWYCREMQTILLRPRPFDKRSVQFVLLKVHEASCVEWKPSLLQSAMAVITGRTPIVQPRTGASDWLCCRVPLHLECKPWSELVTHIESFDQLVLADKSQCPAWVQVAKVFQAFEPKLIHILLDHRSTLIFELPRYAISFELIKGQLHSKDFRGFVLSSSQQLSDALYGFEQYLVLEKVEGDRAIHKIIIPEGIVTHGPEEAVASRINGRRLVVDGSSDCMVHRRLHAFAVCPRFKTLKASCIEARLQLAALYAATGTELPEPRSKQTGGEVAIELLRQCWTQGRVASAGEHRQLKSLLNFGQRTPALTLLVHEISQSQCELEFLLDGGQQPLLPISTDSATEYIQRKQRLQLNDRAMLTPDEERRTGTKCSARLPGPSPARSVQLASPLVDSSRLVDEVNKNLASLLQVDKTARRGEPFPIESERDATALRKQMEDDLRASWEADQQLPWFCLRQKIRALTITFKTLFDRVCKMRTACEEELLSVVGLVPVDSGGPGVAFRMFRAANLAPHVTVQDLARAAWMPHALLSFNPLLSDAAVHVLRVGVLNWLTLCVLEDKLERMRNLAAAGNSQELERELQEIERTWNVKDHPQWLVFEVEQRLQIRRLQHTTADYLMNNPGLITQLNMGEGKTRVILPMIILEVASPERLVRLHMLSQLLGEGYEYLHLHLTASLMRRRLCLMPFHRDIRLRPDGVDKMLQVLMRCQASRGVLIVAPEHRLSLQLKFLELRLAALHPASPSETAAQLVASLPRLDQLPYSDWYDESDEILRHKYQLIYAVGACEALPAGPQRWTVVQALLKQLMTDDGVKEILERDGVAKRVWATRHSGAFDDIRLLPGAPLDAVREELMLHLCQAVLTEPPYPMRWLLKLEGWQLNLITEFATDPAMSLADLDAIHLFPEIQRNYLLALRGQLACGLLEHCLSRRRSVDYGIDRREGARRLVAVPFRASDTPAERAEYAQPDTLIDYTHLAYYGDGLSHAEIKEAVKTLLEQGPSAQKEEYALWLLTAKSTMSSAELDALDKVEKLDLTSEVQLDMLSTVYRYNMEVINYWLSHCVLPRETMQFPHRLVTNACNLTDNAAGDLAGFSGTQDNRFLLPPHVVQKIPDEKAMLATDGKMLKLMLRNEKVLVIDVSVTLADETLDLVIRNKTSALIDAGALMAGKTNLQVARMVLERLPEGGPVQGIVYFEMTSQAWYVHDRRGSVSTLASSPITERDCIVYFDESRCLGADMKLNLNALAIVTVGPGMCKDKIMQALGRMRQLDRGQGAIFVVPPELGPKICAASRLAPGSTLKSKHLLVWVMGNTVATIASGLPEWGGQGSHFCTTQDPELRLLDENLKLSDLYAGAITESSVFDEVIKTQEAYLQRVRAHKAEGELISAEMHLMMRGISQRAAELGKDITVRATGLDEECERELETERELEREVVRQLERMAPRAEVPWDFDELLTASHLTPSAALRFGQAKHIMVVIKERVAQLQPIPWHLCSIWMTDNFIRTVTTCEGAPISNFGEFLRPLDSIVLFEDGKCLLVSEYEADKIIGRIWVARSTKACLVNLAYIRHYSASSGLTSPVLHLRKPGSTSSTMNYPMPGECTIAGLQLLAGDTCYVTQERKNALKELVPTSLARQTALRPAALHGLQCMVSRSDLEQICAADVGEL